MTDIQKLDRGVKLTALVQSTPRQLQLGQCAIGHLAQFPVEPHREVRIGKLWIEAKSVLRLRPDLFRSIDSRVCGIATIAVAGAAAPADSIDNCEARMRKRKTGVERDRLPIKRLGCCHRSGLFVASPAKIKLIRLFIFRRLVEGRHETRRDERNCCGHECHEDQCDWNSTPARPRDCTRAER